jgi:hypothetical protein
MNTVKSDITTLYSDTKKIAVGADNTDTLGRDLITVLGVTTVAQAVAALHTRCNGSGTPNFDGLRLGDYLNLTSGLVNGGPDGATIPWNASYKNLQVVIAGFNTYHHVGDTENANNHILFVFRNCATVRAMNPTNDNTGGYPASEMRGYINGAFTTSLITALGGVDYLMPCRRLISNKASYEWFFDKVWLPTEIEVFGVQVFGDELKTYCTPIQIPLYQRSFEYRCKKYNGSRHWWWESSPWAGGTTHFTTGLGSGDAAYGSATGAGGVAPCFCIA